MIYDYTVIDIDSCRNITEIMQDFGRIFLSSLVKNQLPGTHAAAIHCAVTDSNFQVADPGSIKARLL